MEAIVPYKDVNTVWKNLREWHLRLASLEFGRPVDELINQFDEFVAWYDKATANATLDPEQYPPQPDLYWREAPAMAGEVFTRMDRTLVAIGELPPDGFYLVALKLAVYIAMTVGRGVDGEFEQYQAVAAAQPKLQELIEDLAENVPLAYPDDWRREKASEAKRVVAEAYRAESAREGVVPVEFYRLAIRYALLVAERERDSEYLYRDWRNLITRAVAEQTSNEDELDSDEPDCLTG